MRTSETRSPLARTCSTRAPTSDSAGCGAKPWLVPWLSPPGRGARGRRPSSGRLGAAAQHAEQPAHVGERRAAGLGDGAERPGRRGGVGVGGVPAAVGLRDHHGERVGDDVVHLAGDAGALGRGRDLGLLVALDLEPLGAVDAAPRSSPGATGGPGRTPSTDERDDAGEDRASTRRPGASNQPFIATPSRTEPTSAPTIATRCAHRGPCTVTEYSDEQDGEVRGDDERGEERELERARPSRRRPRRRSGGPGARPAERRPRRRSAGVASERRRRRPWRVVDVRRRRDHEQQQEPGAGRVDGEPVRLLPPQQAFPSRHPTRVGAGTRRRRAPAGRPRRATASARRSRWFTGTCGRAPLAVKTVP